MIEQKAKELLSLVGGKDNVSALVHCATRLRFELIDESIADKTAIENQKYVLSVIQSGGQFQVVIGPKVHDYYIEIAKFLDNKESQPSKTKLNIFKIISEAFSPLIPLLAGAGMVKALLTICVEFKLLSDVSATYNVLSAAGNSIFYFMPIFLGITISKQFSANMYVGGAIGAALLDPSITGLIGKEGLNFLGIGMSVIDYSATVFPIFIISFIYSYLEKLLKKTIKQELQLFLVPMICLIILVPLAVLVFGPFGTVIGDFISDIVMWLFNFNKLIAGALFGAVYPFLTVLGLHWGFTPITLQNLSQHGGDIIEGVAACAVFAQIGIAVGVYFKSKKHSRLRQVSGPAMITGFLAGVTEPILFGLVMRYKRLIIITAIAGGIGGAINGYANVTCNAYVFHNIFAVSMMAYSPVISALCGIGASLLSAALLTYFWGMTDADKEDYGYLRVVDKENEIEVVAPITGEIVDLKNVADEVFSSGAAGQGIAIIPRNGQVTAPFSGEVVAVFPSKHAVGLRDDNGLELLIHIGIDTVNLNGKYFDVHVTQGQKVKKGDKLLTFAIKEIEEVGYSIVTPVLVTNADQMEVTLNKLEGEQVIQGDNLMTIMFK